jgi:hypothetical protein
MGDLFVSVYVDQQHFTYRDGNGNLQDAWYGDGSWHLQQIKDAAGSRPRRARRVPLGRPRDSGASG